MSPINNAFKSYLSALAVRGYSKETMRSYGYMLKEFSAWADTFGIDDEQYVTRNVLLGYQRYLYRRRKVDGAPLSIGSQAHRLCCVRGFFSWLRKSDLIEVNPGADIEQPKLPKRLPRDIFTIVEVEAILAVPDVNTSTGLRDRVMMEIFYATGIRRAELVGLDVGDIHIPSRRVFVREGKGRKDRLVPISQRALDWVQRYLLVRPLGKDALFVSKKQQRLDPVTVTRLVGGHVRASGVRKRGACHVFRHTVATLMLENGADVRFVQEMLGHESLRTTQIYTHVAIRKLHEVYDLTHPSAKG